ncbi:MAG: META domain-containing protein [Chitinophagaceae bacterium]
MKPVYVLLVMAFAVVTLSCKSKQKSMTDGKANADLQETYWKLVEINGKKPGPTPAGKREMHIKFRKEQNRLEGFGGCNGLGATYELKEGNRIHISAVISTQIACSDLEIENALKQALETADNYSINGLNLSLNKARMAPLARFEAVYFH